MYKIGLSSQIILASGSPRRQELLAAMGFPFTRIVPNVEEDVLPAESPKDLVERLSHLKASVVAAENPEAWVIGADTIVVIDNKILGKPLDAKEAEEMLSRLEGRIHQVWGGFALINKRARVVHVESHMSSVEIVSMDLETIQRYIATGEPLDKAGAYAIQGVGAHLVSSLEGSYTNVVGLNLSALMVAMGRFSAV